MITVPTTLVLGAGASKPYGFPSGYELRKLLCNLEALKEMRLLGFDLRDISVFCETFCKSEMPSIDAFLARRGEHKVGSLTNATYSDIGKAAIAYCLIQKEDPAKLHAVSDDHWYQYLWSFMADSLESFGNNKIRIITFNYDRSLEQYLISALLNSFGITRQEAADHLKKIPILHVYGQLAAIPELAPQGLESRFYSQDVSDPGYLVAAARGIRVINESRDDDEIFDEAYSYLNEARRICFIGFGFDETNVRRLRVDELIRSSRERFNNVPAIYTTSLGLEDAERQKVVNRLNPTKYSGADLNPTEMRANPHRDLKTEKYLRATGVFLS